MIKKRKERADSQTRKNNWLPDKVFLINHFKNKNKIKLTFLKKNKIKIPRKNITKIKFNKKKQKLRFYGWMKIKNVAK